MKISFNGLDFVIEEDYPEVGVYLYVYQNGKCIRDYLQNSIEACKEIALENFDVPIEKWV
ncbi:hypothetical protein [Roseivirga seohaensis]|uniref:hypothetical protein n=1 Tax=Roseivirga seohaensis TaxID=1914963 RepID=UPI003BAA2717